MNSTKPSYNAQGYLKQGADEMKMKSIISSPGQSKRNAADRYWDGTHSSQEELMENVVGIIVKTTVHQNDEISSHSSKHGENQRTFDSRIVQRGQESG